MQRYSISHITKSQFMNFKQLALLVLLYVGMVSCSSHKNTLTYFKDLPDSGTLPADSYLPKIQPDDELIITVNSEQPLAAVPYVLPLYNPALKDELARTSSPRMQTYLVDADGYIDFPVLGRMKVAGMSVDELRDDLTAKIAKDIADPIVFVRMADFTVVVAGEVTTPRVVKVTGNRLTILEALAEAGDITPYGERGNVLVIREIDGKREYQRLDLNKAETLLSPYYYLQPNDYVYVSPNAIRQDNARYNQNNSYKLSVISTIVSASSVIASLVIALTIK